MHIDIHFYVFILLEKNCPVSVLEIMLLFRLFIVLYCTLLCMIKIVKWVIGTIYQSIWLSYCFKVCLKHLTCTVWMFTMMIISIIYTYYMYTICIIIIHSRIVIQNRSTSSFLAQIDKIVQFRLMSHVIKNGFVHFYKYFRG